MKPWFLASVCIVSACSSDALVDPVSPPITAIGNPGGPGLEQTVTFSTSTIAIGDSFTVHSVVVNRGTVPATVGVSCVRGVGLSGVSFHWRDVARCQGWWLGPLAPGDSLVENMTTPPVTSAPGDYTIIVGQLVRPTDGVPVRIRIVAGRSRPSD